MIERFLVTSGALAHVQAEPLEDEGQSTDAVLVLYGRVTVADARSFRLPPDLGGELDEVVRHERGPCPCGAHDTVFALGRRYTLCECPGRGFLTLAGGTDERAEK